MTEVTKKRIPECPLMSAGADSSRMCTQERCAWYIPNTKTCAVFVIGHNNMLEVKAKQQR